MIFGLTDDEWIESQLCRLYRANDKAETKKVCFAFLPRRLTCGRWIWLGYYQRERGDIPVYLRGPYCSPSIPFGGQARRELEKWASYRPSMSTVIPYKTTPYQK